jgi:NADPH-dependent 2,4-dienoyl-CoA reductase/sulfur reductase-like enzyme
MAKRIVIIGANASGVEAAAATRKKDRTAEITLVTQEKTSGYSRCGLPFVVGGQIGAFKDLVVYQPAFFQMLKLNLRLETYASAISIKDKTVTIQTKEGTNETLPYDSLIIATGGHPLKAKRNKVSSPCAPLRMVNA